MFTSSLTALLISFDRDTNMALPSSSSSAVEQAHIPSQSNCIRMFANETLELLSADALCYWLDSATLKVLPGRSATLTPENEMVIKEGAYAASSFGYSSWEQYNPAIALPVTLPASTTPPTRLFFVVLFPMCIVSC